jgi:hypothetical protein
MSSSKYQLETLKDGLSPIILYFWASTSYLESPQHTHTHFHFIILGTSMYMFEELHAGTGMVSHTHTHTHMGVGTWIQDDNKPHKQYRTNRESQKEP